MKPTSSLYRRWKDTGYWRRSPGFKPTDLLSTSPGDEEGGFCLSNNDVIVYCKQLQLNYVNIIIKAMQNQSGHNKILQYS
jgi:hypothetical protein